MNNDKKKHDHLMATDWNYAIKEHIKTGLESPIPYKVIPYKNGVGIKKIDFLTVSIRNGVKHYHVNNRGKL